MVDVTGGTFENVVLSNVRPALVDFWAEWCGPCRMIIPILDEIAAQRSAEPVVARLTVDDSPKTSRQHRVMLIPLMAVFEDGKRVGEILGAQPKHAIEEQLDEYLRP